MDGIKNTINKKIEITFLNFVIIRLSQNMLLVIDSSYECQCILVSYKFPFVQIDIHENQPILRKKYSRLTIKSTGIVDFLTKKCLGRLSNSFPERLKMTFVRN